MKRILLLVVFLTGCTTMKGHMDNQLNQHIDNVMVTWGAPSTTFQRNDGGSVYTWLSGSCRQTLVTNPQHIVTNYSYSGCLEVW